MKILNSLLFALIVFGFIGCQPMLLKKEFIQEFSAPADKALVVVLRRVSVDISGFGIGGAGGGGDSKLFVDRKYVSGTTKSSLTSFEVDPGDHFIISKTDIKTPLKFNFKAGKVYYILQTTFPIPFVGTGNSVIPVGREEAEKNIKDMKAGGDMYAYPNPENPQDDLSEDDFKDLQEEWEEITREKPEEAKKSLDYPGY